MNLVEYRRAQDTITRQVVAAVVATLRALAGRPLTPAQWQYVLDALFPTVVQGRRASVDLALSFYRDHRADHTDTAPSDTGPSGVEPPDYDRAALDQLLTRTARPRLGDPDTARAGITTTAAAVMRHVEQAGRDTIITASDRDPLTVRWARVPTGRETCAFCWMLASRGPVYRIPAAPSDMRDMRAWHDGCDCLAVPVFDPNDWPGRDTHHTARDLWRTSTAGYSGRDALNAFRRALYTNPPQTT
ncbi:MAG: hypothetical protein GEV28_27880 [Actinophytocola sp.]|uniref:VG15 protein n=1 Tax=Actinophytocola sp. TaxID=1872138 RepID=UPI0013222190|nr:hypothetical protein [Actinophytocola sp.]MPZ84006.1 hypothetical protein [Actinophytocola sp.]